MTRRQLTLLVFAAAVLAVSVVQGGESLPASSANGLDHTYRSHPYWPTQYRPVWLSPGSPRYFVPAYGYAVPGFALSAPPVAASSFEYGIRRPLLPALAPMAIGDRLHFETGQTPWLMPGSERSSLQVSVPPPAPW